MKRLKSEKGVITIVTLATILFMLSFLISSYVVIANKVKTQKEILVETRKIYEPKYTMEEIYNSYFDNDNVIPIYSVEELLAIKETQSNINGRYYTHNENTVYVLMDDLEFSAIDLNLKNNWTPIDNNANFIGDFNWNDNTIKVTTLNGNIERYDGKTLVTTIAYKNLEQEASSDIKAAVDNGKLSTVLKETINGVETIAVVPKGYQVSTKEGENSISGGLVITDGTNEFVWIPVKNSALYEEDGFGQLTDSYTVSGEIIGRLDSYQTIQYLYGTVLGTINSNETFNKTFTYTQDKENIERSIRLYTGFYVGRYETTYDGRDADGVLLGIGVKRNKDVLTIDTVLKSGINANNNDEYHCRWWGLYKANKDIYTGNEVVGSIMITSKQWDAIMEFTGYGGERRGIDTYTTKPDKSASVYTTDKKSYDVSKNIYDMAGNVYEFTLNYSSTNKRVFRGGYWGNAGNTASIKEGEIPTGSNKYFRF